MKAFIVTTYGSPEVLQLRDVEKPTPKDHEVLIRVIATTVSSGDWRIRSLDVPTGFKTISRLIFGFSKPRQPILGTEFSGEIESIGSSVTGFRVGDPVFGYSDSKMGAHAEYLCMPEDGAIAIKPANLSFEEAAALSFGGATALNFFRRGNLQSGEKVLVNGASGAVGTAAVQIARHFGAVVTGVCSTRNIELVRSLGASHVIDYTAEDFTKNSETYDIIMDTAGTAPFSHCKESLTKGGRLLKVLGSMPDMLQAPMVSMISDKKVIAGPASGSREDLQFLAELAEKGEYKPVIDRRYPFEQMVEAHRYVDTGRKRGNVVVTVQPPKRRVDVA
ncbi:MAG TPA: NAD(P)-dependent alcohol dehydrogenase [Halalkalibaculum sp.]|nr:NAD(P)-dependent alcohol dehydrogenase [Halalkalibaculum sp.]